MKATFTSSRTSVLVCALLVVCSGTLAWSQATSTGSISGQVTDQSGAVIPGAQVTLIDNATKSVQTASSNEAGRYVFINVASGTYSINVTREGFSKTHVADVDVKIGSSLTYNIAMKVGAVTEVVTVEATNVAALNTTSATVGNTVDSTGLLFLPNLGRDVSTLAVLQPAVTASGFTAGAYNDQNTYTLDGGNNSDDMAGNTIGYLVNSTGTGGGQASNFSSGVMPTPVESIEEVRVGVAGAGFDFNNSIGANVQMVTKRGTNQFHGSAYWTYFNTTTGGANTWANTHTIIGCDVTKQDCRGFANPIVSNHRNRPGFSVGGPMLPRMLGGKTYFFFNYEAFRYPNVGTYERTVPTLAMRAGFIQVQDANSKYQAYNLNPTAVTVGSAPGQPTAASAGGAAVTGTVAPGVCGTGPCDPRNIGLNSIVNQIWSKYMPLPNDFTGAAGDTYNTAGYLSTIRLTQRSTFYVGRVDHDFGDKHRFMASYRYYRLGNLTSNQVDIGGALAGDTFGQPASQAPRPQLPSYFVTGLTSTLTPHMTNDFRFNYTRNWWQWSAQTLLGGQLPGMGGMLEIAGESANALIPYNVNTQNTRQRFWDGQDKLYKDDVSYIKGNHLFQFGGSYQRNNDYHSRTDNGAGQNNQVVYQSTTGLDYTGYFPTAVPATQQTTYRQLANEVLGVVTQSQVVYARQGSALNLLPIGNAARDRSIIPFYNVYAGDTWHLRPGLTLVYGMAWALELPPYELEGRQITAVDPSGAPISADDYFSTKARMALQGQNYNPQVGFALVGNIGKGLKYPYNTFYGAFSPRVALAWNPSYSDGLLGKIVGNGKTVIRGSYGRIYGRLNGVDQVLVPLLGPGFLQATSCTNALKDGTCGTTTANPLNAFRIGTDGLTAPLGVPSQTLPQPYFPGLNGAPGGGDINTIDPKFKPNHTDNFTFSIQRQINRKMSIDVGYIGRITKNDFQEINLDAVPFMYTLGGQSFAQAWAGSYLAYCGTTTVCAANPATPWIAPTGAAIPSGNIIPVQPFFEAALGGVNSTFCKGFTSCTAAVFNNATNLSALRQDSVSTFWNSLSTGASATSWVPGKTTIGQLGQATSVALSTSLGFSNYNALYISYRVNDFHGLTLQSNFTWSKALGTGELGQYNSSNTALNPFDMQANYGTQLFDYKYVYNLVMYYQTPWYKSQRGIVGHLLGGWTVSPLFQAQSGAPVSAGYTEAGPCGGCQAFGEVATPNASQSASTQNAVLRAPFNATFGRILNASAVGINPATNAATVQTNNPTGQSAFSDPAAVISMFRPCILGYDTSCGGYQNLHGLSVWNLDASFAKDFSLWKENRVGATLQFQLTNILNHLNPGNPAMTITTASTFGRITGTSFSLPRAMSFGLRIHF